MANEKVVERCSSWVSSDYSGHKCGAPVKRDGMCGVHARAADRRRAGYERRRAEHEASEATRSNVAAELDRLAVEGYPQYVLGSYTGDAVVSLSELRRIVEGGADA